MIRYTDCFVGLNPFSALMVLFDPYFKLFCTIVFDYGSFAPLNSKSAVGNVLCNGRTRSGISAVPYLYGSNKVSIAADESIVADNCAELVFTVVICGSNAAAEVYTSSHIRVAYIGKM